MSNICNIEDDSLFAAEVVRKIKDKEQFSEDEMAQMTWRLTELDRQYEDNRRWSRYCTLILLAHGRYIALDYDEGLTEYQENEYYEQPYFVKPMKKMIEVNFYERIEV